MFSQFARKDRLSGYEFMLMSDFLGQNFELL